MADKGFILTHRKIRDCVIWDSEEPFDRRSAWIDLIMMCNHSDKTILFDGEPIVVKRGQFLTSVRKLSEIWHWGKDKTLRYLRLLEQLEMIHRDSDTRRTLITVVNYEVYQTFDISERDSNEDTHASTIKDSPMDTHKDTHKPQTKNNKNIKKNEESIIKNDIDNDNDNERNVPRIVKSDKYTEEIHIIIDYLNNICGTHYKYGENNAKHIRARLKEGFTVDDFKTVIDKKNSDWKDNDEMVAYLRPQTLFIAEHFESYLNQIEKKGDSNSGRTVESVPERVFESEEDLERFRQAFRRK